METTEKKLSLVERFNQVGEPPSARWVERHPGEKYYANRVDMTEELRTLLELEVEDCLMDHHQEPLAEYKKYLDWDPFGRSTSASWTLFAETFVECDDLNELKEYLNKDKELEVPYADDVCIDDGSTTWLNPHCHLSGLKLKEKSSYSLVLNIESVEQEGIAAAITDLINQSTSGMKVVSCTQAT